MYYRISSHRVMFCFHNLVTIAMDASSFSLKMDFCLEFFKTSSLELTLRKSGLT